LKKIIDILLITKMAELPISYRALRIIIFFLLTVQYSSSISAQNYIKLKNASRKSVDAFNTATKYLMQDDQQHALDQLEELTREEPKFIDAWLLLGELYNEQKKYLKGKEALEKVVLLDPDYASKAWFFLSESNWHIDSFYACADACEKFLSFRTISVERKKQAEHMMSNALFAAEAIRHPVPFDPKSLGSGINSMQPEYLPSLTGDEQTIVFTRRMGKGLLANEDFYISSKVGGEWTTARPMDNVNTQYNEGAQTLAPDGNSLYYVSCDKPGGYGSCDIYFTRRQGNSWSPVEDVGPPVCTQAWETQPSVSADGNELYFVSRRSDGKGGSDIYVSRRDKKGRWNIPVNLGDSINTAYDEKSPFIHADGKTLYFSSAGHPGFGGDDIFYSRKKEDGTWSGAKNIGYPINTRNDENSFVVGLSGENAYFTSDRHSDTRNFDLFYFDLYEAARPLLTTFLKGVIVDAGTSSPVPANVQLIDLVTGNIIAQSDADPVDGSYLISIPNGKDYALNVSAKGYLFYSENFSLKNHPAEKPFAINVGLKPISVGGVVVLRNIFFETDSYVLKDESKFELNKLIELLTQNPALKIQVSGHTDNAGSDQHNQALSESRAKTVSDYLIRNGIASIRLAYKGYGESGPVATNDTEEGRAQNRRTEFIVISK
jgi:outer membrane protein OmpA-like peptidoglycan-associated protein/Tol biopolymer transport system component